MIALGNAIAIEESLVWAQADWGNMQPLAW